LFPGYDSYFLGYEHNRSCSGYIRLTNKQLSGNLNVLALYQLAFGSQDLIFCDIMDTEININAYKYHIFPKIKTNKYEVIDIQDCSITNFKRLKAKLILSERMSKSDVLAIIKKIISELATFETPQNPHENVSWGKNNADMVFLNIFVDGPERKNFNLFPNNASFIGLAHFYKDDSCPKLEHGGVMNNLWRLYKKEKTKENIDIAWNPKYKKTFD